MKSVHDKGITNQLICNVLKEVNSFVYSSSFFSNRVKMSWNIGDNRNFFLKCKSELGRNHVVLTTL